MFLVLNKEKIQTYIVSVLTVAILIGLANIENIKTVSTSVFTKLLPIYNVQTEEKKVAFTMNCAWNADDIDSILETLKKHNIYITFFVVGDWVDKYPDVVKKIYDAGHEIGSHSNTHPHVNNLSAEKNLEEIKLSVNKIEKMSNETAKMVRSSIDAFVNKDLACAKDVIKQDDIVDALFLDIKSDIIRLISVNRNDGEFDLDILMIAKYLERIGDHATNIAETVIYSITGKTNFKYE